MSFNNADFGSAFSHAWAHVQKHGSVGGSGSGGRRGGRGGGRGDGGIRKDSNARCHKCRSPGHLIADCPYKDESRRECRKRLREAASAQEVLPAPVEQPALLSPPSAPAPAPAPASAQRQQVATELEMLNDEQRAIEERLIEIRRRRQQLLQQLQANTEPAVKEEEQDQD